jgi:uncharacterized membrane protein YdbT with pleckstrin-like domain
MSYLQSILRKDEQVYLVAKQHWMQFWPAILTFALALFSTITIPFITESFGYMNYVSDDNVLSNLIYDRVIWVFPIVLFILTVGIFLIALIHYLTVELAVTDTRVVLKKGFISRSTVEQQIDRVDSVSIHQGLFGRVFDYGTVRILGSGSSLVAVNWVNLPLKFRHAVEYAINASGYKQAEGTRL